MDEELSDDELIASVRPRRKEKENSDNYFQSLFRPYYDFTQKHYPGHNKLIFSKAMQLFTKRPTMFSETIAWAVSNKLHPLAFVKTVNKVLK